MLGGCTVITDSFVKNDFSGDAFPVDVQLGTGAIVAGIRIDDDPASDQVAVLDVLSPVTLRDPGFGAAASLTFAQITLLGVRDTGEINLPRARFRDTELIALHPCADASCAIGPGGAEQPFGAILGANALAGDALRLRLGDGQLFVLADIGGTDRDRTFNCDAVFTAPYRGGGTLIIAGTEVPFGGRRITMQTCLGADPDPGVPQAQRGADALLVMSTGIGSSLLSETAYARYRDVRPDAPALDALPEATVFLSSGPITGRRATIDRIAVAGDTSSSGRPPCRQVYAHHLLTPGDCPAQGADCPCNGADRFCAVPAVVELAPAAGVTVLVVSDANATLQALRTELRPDQPEVDGILGADAIHGVELDVDYPHNRVLMRCASDAPGECAARPALASRDDRARVQDCIAAGATPRGM